MDFEKFYDHQIDYEAFRNNPEKREEYYITIDWKARQLEKLIPASLHFNRILEVGCAMGILLKNLSGRLSIKDRTGLDISSENIKLAKKLDPEIVFLHGTIEALTTNKPDLFQFSKFDLILLSDIVEHIPDDVNFMQEVKNISSFVLLNLPLEKCFTTRKRKYGESDPSGHLRSYDDEMAVKLIKDAGFSIINSFKANAWSDKLYRDMYLKKRQTRIQSKPAHLRIFWGGYYIIEDRIKIFNNRLSEKLFGTNYLALLKSDF